MLSLKRATERDSYCDSKAQPGDTLAVAPSTLAEDDLQWNEEANDTRRQLAATQPAQGRRCKSELMAELMSRPETYDRFGAAWRLAMRLLHSTDGVLVGTYQDIAALLGSTSRDSVKNWAKRLAKHGVLTMDQKGWQVTLRLLGDYMSIARAPLTLNRTVTFAAHEDPRLAGLKRIAAGAAALGGHINVTIEGCTFGDGDGNGLQ
jgi:hypothetical protein